MPEKFDNAASFLLRWPSVHTNPDGKRDSSKTLFKPENFERGASLRKMR